MKHWYVELPRAALMKLMRGGMTETEFAQNALAHDLNQILGGTFKRKSTDGESAALAYLIEQISQVRDRLTSRGTK